MIANFEMRAASKAAAVTAFDALIDAAEEPHAGMIATAKDTAASVIDVIGEPPAGHELLVIASLAATANGGGTIDMCSLRIDVSHQPVP